MRLLECSSLRLFVLLMLLTAAQAARAQTSIPHEVGYPAYIARAQPIAPGASGVFAISARNIGGSVGNATVSAKTRSPVGTAAGYQFVPRNPTLCAAPVVNPIASTYERIDFPVGPIGIGETVTCEYTLTRAPGMAHDLAFNVCYFDDDAGPFGIEFCVQSYVYGSLPDLSLSAEPVAPILPGDSEALIRVRLTNPSNFDVAARIATTECREFQGGLFGPTAFDVETGFAGSCTLAQGLGCANFTGQAFMSYGFELAPVAARSSTSCLLRLRFRAPASQPAAERLFLLDDRVLLAGGGAAVDPDAGNDDALLGLLAVGSTAPIPLSRSALALMLVALMVSAIVAVRRNGRTAH